MNQGCEPTLWLPLPFGTEAGGRDEGMKIRQGRLLLIVCHVLGCIKLFLWCSFCVFISCKLSLGVEVFFLQPVSGHACMRVCVCVCVRACVFIHLRAQMHRHIHT